MAINIEMNYFNGSKYEVLYPSVKRWTYLETPAVLQYTGIYTKEVEVTHVYGKERIYMAFIWEDVLGWLQGIILFPFLNNSLFRVDRNLPSSGEVNYLVWYKCINNNYSLQWGINGFLNLTTGFLETNNLKYYSYLCNERDKKYFCQLFITN